MITKKLKVIFAISIPVFIVHGVEEFISRFYDADPLFGLFSSLTKSATAFTMFEIMLILLLIVSLLLIVNEAWKFYFFSIIGIVYIYELQHIIKAFAVGGYYPGLYTSLAFPFLAFVFWKEWLQAKKQRI